MKAKKQPKFGKIGTSITCPRCDEKVNVLVYGRHKGSPTCAMSVRVNKAVEALNLNTFDKILTRVSLTVKDRPTRAIAIGIDLGIDAVTVVHMDGSVRQYISGEWGPSKARRVGRDGFGIWW